ncbi:outer membrane beta-barrel protein [Flaviaesturariibacter amylovorans]|uniref:Outer membrane protein beta-barrel domain-containing protein n=1 Tax=Flaviaesturariibacter amylovorans TaxID=1084520 RepID=A0ABP8G959_9BACT
MLYLRRTQKAGLILLTLLFSTLGVQAQFGKELNLPEHDAKPYYFGITLAGNMARFHTEQHPYFLSQDTVYTAEPINSGGFGLGLLATARLNHRFEVRFNPTLIFMERSIQYRLKYADPFEDDPNSTLVTKKVESVMTSFPLQLKFRSDRIHNFRVYMLGGVKLDYDLASNAKARQADNMIRIGKIDYGIEAGLGFNFYFQSFIFSPEIKISNGQRNMHDRNANLKYSNVIDRIQSRMIVFSIHLEG